MNTGDTKYLLSLVGFALFAVLWPYCSIFFHETGCVIFAKLAGMNPYKVRVGKGKILFILKIVTVQFEFCDCPVSGFTFTNHVTLDKLKSLTLLLLLGGLSAKVEKAYLLDMLCGIVINKGDMNYLDEADKWSKDSFSLAPWSNTVRGTRGVILVEKGRYSEAEKLLLPLTKEENEMTDRLISACY